MNFEKRSLAWWIMMGFGLIVCVALGICLSVFLLLFVIANWHWVVG